MRARLVHEADGQRTFVAVLETGEEVMASLERLAREQGLSAAQITAIGAFSGATLTYFDWETKEYAEIPVREQVEVASMLGDVALGPDAASRRSSPRSNGRRGPFPILLDWTARGTGRPTWTLDQVNPGQQS